MSKYKALFKNKKYTMMKDFDILAMTNQDEKQLYEEANFQKGVEMMTPTYVRNQDGEKYSIFISVEEFKEYGPGIYLLFLFLKYAAIFFFFISIISFVNIGVLLEGGQLNDQDSNFQMDMARSTLGNVQNNQLVVIIIFDYIITVLILAAIIYWKEKQATYVVESCKEIMLPSYQTVILKQVPELYTEYDMKVFLEERFGEVLDIYTVRNFNNDLYHYKQITKIANEYKLQRALVKIIPERSPIKLAKLFFDYEGYYFKMQQQNRLSKYPKQFAYITFKSVKSRQEMLKFYQRTFLGLSEDKKQHYIYKGQDLKLKACLMEPNGILWQNLNREKKYKVMWILIQICLLILVLFISITVIFIFYVSESSMSQTQYYGMPKDKILALNKKDALQSYCLGLSIQNFNSDSDCDEFQSQYVKFTIFLVALPLVIALFKFILTQIMKALVNIRRHPYEIAKIQSQIVIMFVFYFFASGILQYIVFLEIHFQNQSRFSFVQIMSPIQNSLAGYLDIDTSAITMAIDYNRTWYTIASYKIILIALVSFNASSFGKIAYSFLRKLACDVCSRKQTLQCRMNYWLEGQQMEIQFVYAVAATIICFLLLFGASIPLIYPFIFLSLLILYWSTKFIFINFCAKPFMYSHSMNSLLVKILLFGVILHCMVSPLYFGASTIHSEQGIRNFLRIPYYGYYIVLIVIAFIYLLYRESVANMFEKIKNYYETSQGQQDDFVLRRQKKMSLSSKLCLIEPVKNPKNRVMSYSMHQNPEYECILKTLYTINKEQRIRATCVLNKQLQGLLQKDQIFAESQGNSHTPKLFYDLLEITQQNFSKFQKRVGKQYSKSNNPFKFYLKQLKDIQKSSKISQVDPQIYAQIQSEGFRSNSLKSIDLSWLKQHLESNKDLNQGYLKKLESLKKRFKPKPNLKEILERSEEESVSRRRNSIDGDLEEAPNSDVRLRSNTNMGMVSNLGMVSNIRGLGVGPGGAISNLGTMSRVGYRNSLAVQDDNPRDIYLLDDRFDCIKQTQSILDSKVYSKRYKNQPPQRDLNIEYEIKVSPTVKDLGSKQVIELEKQTEQKPQKQKEDKEHSDDAKKRNKSKNQQILKAYKRKRKLSKDKQVRKNGFEPSASSYDSGSS